MLSHPRAPPRCVRGRLLLGNPRPGTGSAEARGRRLAISLPAETHTKKGSRNLHEEHRDTCEERPEGMYREGSEITCKPTVALLAAQRYDGKGEGNRI